MFILACKDCSLLDCPHIAKSDTEDKIVLLMLEHIMKSHPGKLGELLLTMTRDDIAESLRQQIQKEVEMS